MTIGERIAQRRKELGLSQEALGERMGVSRQAIYKWESDAALPEIEKLVKLAREFGVSVGWLLGEEDNAPEKRELTPEQLRRVGVLTKHRRAVCPRLNHPALPHAPFHRWPPFGRWTSSIGPGFPPSKTGPWILQRAVSFPVSFSWQAW